MTNKSYRVCRKGVYLHVFARLIFFFLNWKRQIWIIFIWISKYFSNMARYHLSSLHVFQTVTLFLWIHRYVYPIRSYSIFLDDVTVYVGTDLKGTLTRDFRPQVFHQTTSLRPLIYGLMPFSICISIRRENRLCNRRYLSQRSQLLRCDVHSGVIGG
jgi:hypothetical protein